MTSKDKLLFQEFAAAFDRCAVCHWPESDPRRRLEIHHLMSGSARKHDRRNLLKLCSQCHGIYHGGKIFGNFPDIDKRILLGAKRDEDPDHYDPRFLAELRHRKHLGYEPEEIPEWYRTERVRNQSRSR
jgi:hypothetical protein